MSTDVAASSVDRTGYDAPRSDHDSAVSVTVRYFAAARAASGVNEEVVQPAAPATVTAVLDEIVQRHGAELARVLERCSFLKNTIAVHSRDVELVDGDALDVLPPFAGG